MSERIMSDDFDSLDATEKAGTEAALNRCRTLAAQIESELRNKRPGHFVDKWSLADFYISLEHAAAVLTTVKGSRARHR
jgi:glutathione S-transferase